MKASSSCALELERVAGLGNFKGLPAINALAHLSTAVSTSRRLELQNRFGASASGIIVETVVNQMLQFGEVRVDEAQLAALCRRYRVLELSLFGSAARGEMRPDSDIDLLVAFLPDAEVDLVDYAGLMLDLSRLLGRKVDLVSKNGLKPLIRASVLGEARLVYAA